jgi:hypothetical protein
MERKKARAKELVPGWNAAVKQRFGECEYSLDLLTSGEMPDITKITGEELRYTCVGSYFI